MAYFQKYWQKFVMITRTVNNKILLYYENESVLADYQPFFVEE